jgi:hypothetical protein
MQDNPAPAFFLRRMNIVEWRTFSLNNVFLIHSQRPEATRVAGFAAWRKLGRFVRRGEKGIAILVPITYRHQDDRNVADPSTEVDGAPRALVGFKAGYVFDGLSRDSDHEDWSPARASPGSSSS